MEKETLLFKAQKNQKWDVSLKRSLIIKIDLWIITEGSGSLIKTLLNLIISKGEINELKLAIHANHTIYNCVVEPIITEFLTENTRFLCHSMNNIYSNAERL